MGFSFGNLQGRGGWFGNCPILSMWFGNYKYYPAGHSIVLDSTGASVSNSSSYNTISLTASTSAWTISSNVYWITPSKVNAGSAFYSVSANGMMQERTGIISFMIDGVVYATYTIIQAAADAPFPQEWGVLAEDGDWAFATMPYPDDASKTLVAVIYRYRNQAPPNSVEYTLDCPYLYLEDGDSVEAIIYNEYTIEPYDTITVDGETYYGAFVDTLDSMVVDGQTMYYIQDLEDIGPVTQFSVSVV